MTLKHILLELQQWFQLKMQEKKFRRKFVLTVCGVVAVLIAGTAINGWIMQKQFANMGSYSSTSEDSRNVSQNGWPESGEYHGWSRQYGERPGTSKAAPNSESNDVSSLVNAGMGMDPTPLTSGIIMVGILSVALITGMVMYLHYRKEHMDHIPPLTVLKTRED